MALYLLAAKTKSSLRECRKALEAIAEAITEYFEGRPSISTEKVENKTVLYLSLDGKDDIAVAELAGDACVIQTYSSLLKDPDDVEGLAVALASARLRDMGFITHLLYAKEES